MLDGAAGSEALQLFSTSTALFVENQGQWQDEAVRYAFDGPGVNIAFTDQGLSFLLTQQEQLAEDDSGDAFDCPGGDRLGRPDEATTRTAQFSVSFDGANTVTPIGLDAGESRFNYLVGDQANWRTGVAGYETVAYADLYDGIDLHTFGRRNSLKYEFYVAPGADYRQIEVDYDGIDGLWIDDAGALHVDTELGELVDDAPYIYQVIDGREVEVAGQFALVDADTYAFEITGAYDPTAELVVDPNLAWSTYLGGSSDEAVTGIAIDASGAAYVTGSTTSTNFPTLGAAADTILGGPYDAFVAKLTNSGELAWSTYLGGSDYDTGHDIAVDASGAAYVTGVTESTDFPTLGAAADTSLGGPFDAFVAKLTSSGSLAWSTYLGGSSDEAVTDNGIAVDASGAAYVTGRTYSTDFPTLGAAADTIPGGSYDAFVTKLTSSGSLAWSTYLGGSSSETGNGITVDASGAAYVTGRTYSTDFPTLGAAADTSLGGPFDAFVAKLTSSGSLAWSTYLGGSSDEAVTDNGIAVDASGAAYVTGRTYSTDFPTLGAAADTIPGGSYDAFVTKLTSSGSLAWSTYLGGSDYDSGRGIAVDASGAAYVTGFTTSPDSSGWVAGGWDESYGGGGGDGFVARIEGAGDAALPPHGVTVITHGWQLEFGQTELPPAWTIEMAHAIVARAGAGSVFVHDARAESPTFGEWVAFDAILDQLPLEGPNIDRYEDYREFDWTNSNSLQDEIVLVYNWAWESNDGEEGWLQAAADNLFASLLAAPLGVGLNVLQSDLHFIGHSRGAVLNSLVVERLGYYFDSFVVDQVTSLDPHPIRLGDGAGLVYDAADPEPVTYANVRYADNYFRQDGPYQVDGDFNGIVMPGAKNVELDEAVLANFSGHLSEHSDVHLWYTATIDVSAAVVEGETVDAHMAANWWQSGVAFDADAEPASGRDSVGYARSRNGGADRSGFSVNSGSSASTTLPRVFNGDFTYGGTLSNEIPGWERHGGGGSGKLQEEFIGTDRHLQLDSGDASRTHNPLYVPPQVIGVEYDYWIYNNDVFSPNDTLQLLLGNEVIDTISLATETNGFALDRQATLLSQRDGFVDTLEFRIDDGGDGIDSGVRIDNVTFLFEPPAAPNADFSADGVVSGGDFLAWQRGYGAVFGASALAGDADSDRDVDGNDLAVWQSQFGTSGAASAAAAALSLKSGSVAASEPPTAALTDDVAGGSSSQSWWLAMPSIERQWAGASAARPTQQAATREVARDRLFAHLARTALDSRSSGRPVEARSAWHADWRGPIDANDGWTLAEHAFSEGELDAAWQL